MFDKNEVRVQEGSALSSVRHGCGRALTEGCLRCEQDGLIPENDIRVVSAAQHTCAYDLLCESGGAHSLLCSAALFSLRCPAARCPLQIFTTLGEAVEATDLNLLLQQVHVDSNGKVKYADFIKAMLK